MTTKRLILALAADAPSRSAPVNRTTAIAIVLGLLASTALFLAEIGVRPDIAAAGQSARFLFKFVVTVSLAAPSAVLVARLARPGAELGHWPWALAIAPALLVAAVLAELVAVPSAEWPSKLVGANSLVCLTVVPALSLSPFVAALLALRHGAVTRPRLAGAVAGLLAGALGATLYASNCTDDSPLFVMTWYPIGVGTLAAVGAILGPRILRW